MCNGLMIVAVVMASLLRLQLTDAATGEAPRSCDYYLAPSKIPYLGKGIFAGRDFSAGEVFITMPTVVMSDEQALLSQLSYYVYSMALDDDDRNVPSDKDKTDALQKVISHRTLETLPISQIVFGPTLLVNNGASRQVNVESFWPNKNIVHPDVMKSYAHSVSHDFGYVFETKVRSKSEIFTSYGGSEWFEQRDIPYNKTLVYDVADISYDSLEELAAVGVCLSDLYWADSMIPMAGRGVFSKRSYKKGETVTVSPILVLSRHMAMNDTISVLLNYLWSRDDTDVAFLPLTLAGMFNHANKATAAVSMRWDSWPNSSKTWKEMLAMHPRELAALPYAPLDVAYIAERDIAEGDELTIYYGAEWESAWLSYLDELVAWRSGSESPPTLATKPVFRRHISIPDDLLPESGSFMVDCVSDAMECALEKNRLDLQINSVSTFDASREYITAATAQTQYTDIGTHNEETKHNSRKCDLYLAPSRIPYLSRGVFAGRDYNKSEVLENTASVTLSFKHASQTQLSNYVYSIAAEDFSRMQPGPLSYSPDLDYINPFVRRDEFQKSECQFAFGASLLMNHAADREDVHSFHGSKYGLKPNSSIRYAHTLVSNLGMFFENNVSVGQEIFTTYGDAKWFKSRDIPYNATVFSPAEVTYGNVQELAAVGTCLSDIYLNESIIPMAGRGVFAKRSFKKGETVTVSPVIVTSRYLAVNDSESIFLNYLLSRDDTDLALLPLTLAGMINHAGKMSSNLALTWFDSKQSEISFHDRLAMHPRELAALPYAPLDVAYIAERDIAEGDELTIYYGAEWESAWLSYLDELVAWRSGSESPPTLATKPVFRRHISIPDDLLPESGSFMVDCVLSDIDCELQINRLGLEANALNGVYASRLYMHDDSIQKDCIEFMGAQLDAGAYNVVGPECAIYLAPSKIPFMQRGIFAGVDFDELSVLERAASVTLSFNHSQSQLQYYVQGMAVDFADVELSSDINKELIGHQKVVSAPNIEEREDFVRFVFGASSMINHAPENNDVGSVWTSTFFADLEIANQYPFTIAPVIGTICNKELKATVEITRTYDEDWFDEDRCIWYDDDRQMSLESDDFVYDSLEELEEAGTCLSHFYLMESKIPMAGKGVFSQRSYKAGEKVTVSPMIVTSRHLAATDAQSILINYLWSRNDTDFALLPVTQAGLFNHASKTMANLKITWEDWSSSLNSSLQERLAMHPRELAALPYAPLDVAYIAERDIAEGDELTIYYGAEWESAWLSYLDELVAWRSGSESPPTLATKPVFRRHISIPDDLLPESVSFMVDCIAVDIDCELEVNRLNLHWNSISNIEAARSLFTEQCVATI